jgi:hypothetical protein
VVVAVLVLVLLLLLLLFLLADEDAFLENARNNTVLEPPKVDHWDSSCRLGTRPVSFNDNISSLVCQIMYVLLYIWVLPAGRKMVMGVRRCYKKM